MKKLILILLILFIALPIAAQRDLKKMLNPYKNPDELVTLSAEIPFEQALEVLSKVSVNTTGQRIVSTSEFNEPIGILIENMHYKQALKVIVQYNGLEYDEKPEVIIVRSRDATAKEELSGDIYAPLDAREVRISGIFFEANITEIRERGINWQFMLSRSGLNIGSDFKSFLEDQTATQTGTAGGTAGGNTQQQSAPEFTVSSESEYTMGEFDGTAEGLFKFFEDENLGELIARPNITVRDGLTGKIQIGEDISIKQQDFSGNVIDRFFPTGTILEVTPYIYEEDGIDYILLKLVAERSSPTVISTTTTRISKTNATTEVLMLNGERTAIGGLFINQERTERVGIPFLKDLPWWVFGLRYIFGYDKTTISKSEVIIILEAEIIPSLKERMADKIQDRQELIKSVRDSNNTALDEYSTKKEDEDED